MMSRILPKKTFITVCFLFLSIVFYCSGISGNQSILISIFLTTNWISGVRLWEILNKDAKLNALLAVGIGSTLGIILSIFFIILSRKIDDSNIGLIFPVLLWVILELLTPQRRNKRKENHLRVTKSDVFAVLGALLPGTIYLQNWWSENPIKWSGFKGFYPDLAFNEAIQNSVAMHDSTSNLMLLGADVRYHWFTHLWTGAVTDVFKLDPFVAATRILPTISLLSLSFISFAFAKEVTNKTQMAIFSTVLITSGVGISYLTGDFYQKSPSLLFSQLILLNFVYLLYGTSEKSINLKQCILMTILYLGAYGSKGSSGLIILGGLLAVILINLIRGKIQIFNAGILVAILTSLTFIIFSILFKGDSSLTLGLHLNWIPLVLCVLLIAPGLLLSKNDFWTSRLIQFSSGTVATGLALSLFFANEDGAQNYFIFHIIAVTAVPSIIYISKIYPTFRIEKLITKENIVAVLIATISLCLWTFGILLDLKLLRGLAPLIVIVLSAFFSYIWRESDYKKKLMENFAFFMATSVLVLSSLSPILNMSKPEKILKDYQKKQIDYSIGMVDVAYKAAGTWVKNETPLDSIWVTNRQCREKNQNIRRCNSDWFYASAFTGRQFLIEGAAFISKSNIIKFKVDSRMDLSVKIGLYPTDENINRLQKIGITYLWIDKNVSYNKTIRSVGKNVFENQSILILRI